MKRLAPPRQPGERSRRWCGGGGRGPGAVTLATWLLSAWAGSAGGAPPGLPASVIPQFKRYGAGPLVGTVRPAADAALDQEIQKYATFYQLASISRRGEGGALAPVWSAAGAGGSLAATTRTEKLALLSALRRRTVMTEIDVLVGDGDGLAPISVYWDTLPELVFVTGARRTSLLVEGVTPAQIRERYGVGEFTELDQKWDARAFAAVERALSLLTPEERALLQGVPFRRARADGTKRAAYTRGVEPARVNVYDATFLFDGEDFMGDPSKPEADSVGVLLHELGHAIADVRVRELSWAQLALRDEAQRLRDAGSTEAPARIQAANELTARLNRIDQADRAGRPAELELGSVFEARRSPTDYGTTGRREHFAECFRLYKADPAALRRVSPEALAWFEAGSHVTIARRPLPGSPGTPAPRPGGSNQVVEGGSNAGDRSGSPVVDGGGGDALGRPAGAGGERR